MIAFATIFLGLVMGLQPVELVVGDRVAAVELLLDGRRVARLDGPPWKASCDFGSHLVPHRLEAVAYDAGERELDRAEQWINLPGPLAESRILLDGAERGVDVVARVTFDSVLRAPPVSATVHFDGEPLTVTDPQRFELPPFDPRQVHFLRVELEFPDGLATVVETPVGGQFGGEVLIRQTAVPVVLHRGGRKLRATGLDGGFLKEGEPLRVLAIDEGPAEVAVVRASGAQSGLDRLAREIRDQLAKQMRSLTGVPGRASLRFVGRLEKDQMAWLLEPFAIARDGGGYDLKAFPFSPHLTPRDGGLPWLLTSVRPPRRTSAEQRLADAVAVAGRGVAERDRRRAVVLVLGEDEPDNSLLSAELARSYLATLRVPLVVWSTAPPTADAEDRWGEVADISTPNRFEREIRGLRELLDSQRIVWLEGAHLPHQISLAAGARELVSFPM